MRISVGIDFELNVLVICLALKFNRQVDELKKIRGLLEMEKREQFDDLHYLQAKNKELIADNAKLNEQLAVLAQQLNAVLGVLENKQTKQKTKQKRSLVQIEEDTLPFSELERLLQLRDKQFVRGAYQLVLQRDADPNGFSFYLSQLRRGVDKVQIVGQLRNSSEGQKLKEPYAGFDVELAKFAKGKKNILQSLLGKETAANRQLAVLEKSQLLQEDLLQERMTRLEDSVSRVAELQYLIYKDINTFLRASKTSQLSSVDMSAIQALMEPVKQYETAEIYEELNQNPRFHKQYYLANNVDVAAGGHDPVMHYAMHGYVDNRSPHPKFSNDYFRLYYMDKLPADVNPLSFALDHPPEVAEYSAIKYKAQQRFRHPVVLLSEKKQKLHTKLDVCIHIHVHYEDVFEEIMQRIGSLVGHATFLLSCSQKAVYSSLSKKYASNSDIVVRLVENRGRDVAPMLVEFGREILAHDVCLHLHTKKSKHTDEDLGRQWLEDILSKIAGDETQIAQVLKMFEQDPQLGVVQPLPFNKILPSMHWMDNIIPARELLQKLAIDQSVLRDFPLYFPAGTMIWFRPQAIWQLLDGRFSLNDFEPEPIGTNGTIAHAIERCINYIAKSNGFGFMTTSQRHLIDKKLEDSRKHSLRVRTFDANCVFCSYSEEHFVPENVIYSLKQLSPYFKELHLVTNRRELNNLNELPDNVHVFLTENKGYDFGMYHRCIQNAGLRGKTFIMNDSVFMLDDPYEMLSKMFASEADMIGFTLSNEVHPHVQSYCMTLSGRAIEEFLGYYAIHGDIDDRQSVIYIYELGFSKFLTDKGWKISGLFEGRDLNPTIFNVMETLEVAGPIIKKKVVLNNWAEDETEHLINLNYNFEYDWTAEILKRYQIDVRELTLGRSGS